MNLIEKTCPKCGANLEFKPGDKEVRCSYCNKQFIIEGNENNTNIDPTQNNMNESIKLVAKVGAGMYIGITIIIFIIAITIIGVVIFTIKSNFSNTKNKNNFDTVNNFFDNFNKSDDSILKSVNDISDEDGKKIQEKSLTEIRNWNKEQGGVTLTEHNHLGYYLVYDDYDTDLYDVYELNYNINGESHIIYTGIEYMSVNYKNKEVKVGNGMIFGTTLSFNMNTLWGYNTIEDLYNNIDSSDGELVASDGLYKN